MEGKRLVRSKRNRMLLGVLGGFAEYFNVDPTLIRLIFVVLLVFNPVTMTVLYFLAAIVIPEEGEVEKPVEERLNDVTREVERVISGGGEKNDLIKAIAIILILLGILYLVAFTLPLFFVFRVPSSSTLVALLLLALGIILLLEGR